MMRYYMNIIGACALGATSVAFGAEDMGNMTMEEHMKMMEHTNTTTAGTEHAHHEHGKGMWMFEYSYMRMNMKGLRKSKGEFTKQEALDSGCSGPCAMAADEMTMDMHMLMGMYGFTDKLSLMVGLGYVNNSMPMQDMMGMTDTMNISGLGDTEVTAMYKYNPHWMVNAGLILPTGSVDAKGNMVGMGQDHAPYYMQPGSGTVGLKPSATMQYDFGAYNVGAQGSYTYRMGYNSMSYNLGDRMDGDAWVKYNAVPHMQLSAGLSGHYLSKVDAKASSHYMSAEMQASMPDYNPSNTGSFRMEAVLGVEATYKKFTAGFEYGIPVYERLRGIQNETHSVLGFSLHAMI